MYDVDVDGNLVDEVEEDLDRPDESDDYIGETRDGYSVSSDCRHLGTYKTERRAAAALYLHRLQSNWWPNIWSINERGNTMLMVFDGHVLRGTNVGYV
jgi:hypothetical protein